MIEKIVFNSLYCLIFKLFNKKSMFAEMHLDINSPQYGLLYLTGKLNSQTDRSAKVKDGIISGTKFLGTFYCHWYNIQYNNNKHNN
jgi:hypothetical protein